MINESKFRPKVAAAIMAHVEKSTEFRTKGLSELSLVEIAVATAIAELSEMIIECQEEPVKPS